MTKNFNTLYTQIHAILSAKYGEVKVPTRQSFESRCEDLYYETTIPGVRISIRTDFVKTTNVKRIRVDLAVKDTKSTGFFPIVKYMLDLYNPEYETYHDIFVQCRGGNADTDRHSEEHILEFVKRVSETV